jgi:cytochrome P450
MPKPLPPGPKGSFLWGNLGDYSRDPLNTMSRYAREYGDVVRMRFVHKPIYLVANPDLVEYVLVRGNRNFRKDFSLQLYRPILGNGLLTSEGDYWLRQRRLAQPAFLRQRINAYGETMVGYTERMLARWRSGMTFDLHAEMMHLTLDIAAKTLFGTNVSEEAAEVGSALETALRCIESRFEGFSYWLPEWLPTRTSRLLKDAIRRLDAIVYRIIEERRKSDVAGDDLISLLLHARGEDDGQPMSDRQLRDESMTLLLAGHETTALSLSWTWYLLSQNPEALQRLQEELEEVLGGRPPTVADLPRLRYTEQTVMESMRLYPPAYAIGREAIEECELGGFRVPAGTTLFLLQWVLHRDNRYFEEPERFRPERWSPERMQKLPKYAYFPFGGGPRQCIGNSFAMMETVLVLATMAQKFEMRLDPGHEVTLWPSITLRPKTGIRVTICEPKPAPRAEKLQTVPG